MTIPLPLYQLEQLVPVRASNFSKDRTNERYWKGDLAELLIYNEELPTSILRKVEGYLAHKWGIESSLTGSHPYRNSAPSRSKSASITKIFWGGTDGGRTLHFGIMKLKWEK